MPPAGTADVSWPPQKASVDYQDMLFFTADDAASLTGTVGLGVTNNTAAAEEVQGAFVSTNAQQFTAPVFDPVSNSFKFTVASPHFKSDGTTVQTGEFEAYIPYSAMEATWHKIPQVYVADMNERGVGHNSVTPTVQWLSNGALLTYSGFNFSTQDVAISPNDPPVVPTPVTPPPGQTTPPAAVPPTPPTGTGAAFTSVFNTTTVDTNGATVSADSGDSHIQLQVPSGAFAAPEAITMTSRSAADAVRVFQATTQYKDYTPSVSFGVNFSGTTPIVPITLTVQNASISDNAKVFKVNADGSLTPVQATVTKGQAVITFSSDPFFVIAAPSDTTGDASANGGGSGSSSSSGSASTEPQSHTTKGMKINGVVTSMPLVVHNGTTYMPIWYVEHALAGLGIHGTWDGHSMKLTTSRSVNLTKIELGSGVNGLYINGHLVHRVNSIAVNDPSTKKPTTYVPIWYLEGVLARIGFTSVWDGNVWSIVDKTKN